jgi:hypothetical protein
MTENAKNPAAQNTIQDPPEYNTENANNPKDGSDWLGGPQNGNETLTGSHYTKHRFSETPGNGGNGGNGGNASASGSAGNVDATTVEGAYQTAAHSTGWEDREMKSPGKQTDARNPQTGEFQKDWNSGHPGGVTNENTSGSAWLGGPQNGNETPGHEKKAPKGSLSGGFEKPSSSSEKKTTAHWPD